MEPVQYLRILRRGWYVIVVLAIVGATAGWFTAPAEPTGPDKIVYIASHTLVADDAVGSLPQVAFTATVGDLPAKVAETLGAEDPDQLASELTVVADTQLKTLEFITVQSTAADAELVVDTFADTLSTTLLDQARLARLVATDEALADVTALDAEVKRLDGEIAGGGGETARAARDATVNRYRIAYERFQNLVNSDEVQPSFTTVSPGRAIATTEASAAARIKGLRATNSSSTRNQTVKVFQGINVKDDLPGEPSQPISKPARAGAGGLLGVLAAIGIVLVLDRLDTRVRSARGAEAVFGVPVLGEIATMGRRLRKAKQVVFLTDPAGVAADGYRRLRTAIRMGRAPVLEYPSAGDTAGAPTVRPLWSRSPTPEGQAPVVLVTSAASGEGKTTVAANLAAAFAETGARVLAIDGDLRRPELHAILRPLDDRSVAGQLESDANSLDDIARPTTVPGVWLLRLTDSDSRSTNPTMVLGRLIDLLEDARRLADVIVLDTGPQLAVSDVDDLLPEADFVVLTAMSGRTKQDAALRVSELLIRADAPLLGVVLVRSETAAGSSDYFVSGPRRRRRAPLGPAVDFEQLPERFSDFSAQNTGPDQPLWRGPPTNGSQFAATSATTRAEASNGDSDRVRPAGGSGRGANRTDHDTPQRRRWEWRPDLQDDDR